VYIVGCIALKTCL